MKEKLLQYIWQFQYFNKSELVTVSGEPLQIIHQGSLNTNQGADFSEGKIKIDDTAWAGNIELHIKSSDWNLHKHSEDKNFGNIILHVVWEHDAEIKDISGNNLPTLELQTRVSKLLLAKYETLMNANSFIPCENQAYTINDLTLLNWKQRLLAERLEAKSAIIISFLNQNNFHWEETFWWLLAMNFGIKVNSQAFEKIARTIPVSILAKHKNQIHQLEALLFGQAGLLKKDFTDDYPQMLQKEYLFYKTKYKLQQPQIQLFFLRMRPANFPTIRLAQLAMLINKSTHLFSKIKESVSIVEVKELLDVTANDYWHYHYVFDEDSAFKKKKLGKQMINNILINTVVPMLFAYGLHRNEQQYKDKAIAWLEDISSEKNFITKGFETLKFSNKNSFDSQSYIQLKNEYCNSKRCLECSIGNSLLKGVQEI
ncbi:MAG: DUF2851 family protein [Chitinophagaceae bacterium]|nr:DUF2851 family protein [Chitinophagaceae bacterium]